MIRNKIRPRRDRLINREEFLYGKASLMAAQKHTIPYPPVNVKNSSEYYDLELVVPGFSKEELTVFLEDNFLTIKGKKNKRIVRDEVEYIQKEYDLDFFKRVFELDDITDLERIKASYIEGVLTVRLYHKEEKTVKKDLNEQVKIAID
ncbi:MAG: Hsp20/alpha crystallin family protein [Bacteroidota bacterium]